MEPDYYAKKFKDTQFFIRKHLVVRLLDRNLCHEDSLVNIKV